MGAFRGTAQDYLRYRPAYPAEMLAQLRGVANTAADACVVDLGCGPGRVALPMAPHVAHVLAIDVEPEMIDAGRAEAGRRALHNIDWRIGRAEDLQLAPASVDLITAGEAFHPLQQETVLTNALAWLRPGGAFATLAGEPPWRGIAQWQRALVGVVNRFTDGVLGDPNALPWEGPVAQLHATGLDVRVYQSALPYTWTIANIVGFLRSTSFASRHALGNQLDAFDDALRDALLSVDARGEFPASVRFGFTLGVVARTRATSPRYPHLCIAR